MKFADFDGVQFHVATPSKSDILVSISWKCFNELKTYGAVEFLKNEYQGLVGETEDAYDFTIKINKDSIAGDKGTVGLACENTGLNCKKQQYRCPHPKSRTAQAQRSRCTLCKGL